MDYQFPSQLFPGFYNLGPPDSVIQHRAGTWGSYGRLLPVDGAGDLSSWTFTSRHQVKGEVWSPTEPAPVPLLSPKHSVLWPTTPPDPLDFVTHMQNFYMDHYQEAFGSMCDIVGPHFDFRNRKRQLHSFNMQKMERFLDLKTKKCPLAYSSTVMDAYSTLLMDAMHTIPPELLGSLLHEELAEQRERMLVSAEATGGALAFVPFTQRGSISQCGCLLYPGADGLDSLNFHTVALQHRRGGPSCVDAKSNVPFRFQLKGPVRQISAASLLGHCCAAVRSDHLCGVWRFSETDKPRLLQVINTTEVATCVSASPHILGEVLVASEGGAMVLWTAGRGIQKIREDEANLYFNASSWWRWCEFSAHPRVMLYADRTGAELTDIREKPASVHTLFRISSASECRSGERLFLSRYLGEVHPFHHLITTQYSAYIMDERFTAVPMVKWDHMMQSPPVFCQTVPGSDSSGGGSRTTKVLLGSHSSQEITLLQYSGGRAESSLSRGPPGSLHRPRDSLKHLPVQIPHRLATLEDRLSSPAAGLTCAQETGRREEECICVFQLTEAGDIFYQVLQPEVCEPPAQDEASPPPFLDHGSPQRQQGASSEDSDSSPGLGMKAQAHQRGCGRGNGDVGPGHGNASGGPGATAGNGRDDTAAELSGSSLHTWRRWILKLMKRRRQTTERGPAALPHVLVNTKGLLSLPAAEGSVGPSEQAGVERLWQDLSTCMSQRSLLVNSATSASLGPSEPAPLPEQVDADAWTDDLSQRLTVSWQGEEAWRSWWKEKLGLDREQNEQALRSRRRREKEARRAAGRRLALSDSFSSSASCLSEWDVLSDHTSCFSTASQAACSDTESVASQRSQHPPKARTPTSVQTGSHAPTATSQPARKPQSTGDSLSSLIPPLESDGASEQTPSAVPSFQRHSSQPLSQRTSRVDLSQDRPVFSSLSQSSQSRPGLSQPKKSRMGF